MKAILLVLATLCALNAHAALRPGPGGGTTPPSTTPGPTSPAPLPTGGGSPTTTCMLYPLACVR